MKKSKLMSILAISLLFSVANAKTTTKEKEVATTGKTQLNFVDMAGKQRMLSQRMVKDYLYKGKKVATSKADKQLKGSIAEFSNALNKLKTSLNDPEVTNLLEFVDMSFSDFKDIIDEPFNTDNAQIALDLSESLLEGSQFVVDTIKSSSSLSKDKSSSEIIAMAGKQRMLSQRIAKYYIAYQAGIKDKNTVDQMKATVKEFTDNHNALMANKTNSAAINQKLNDVDKLWKIVYKFYLSIEKGGLPFIVFKSTDDITKKMNEITKLYVAQAK